MQKKTVSVVLAVAMIGCSVFSYNTEVANAAILRRASYTSIIERIKDFFSKPNADNTTESGNETEEKEESTIEQDTTQALENQTDKKEETSGSSEPESGELGGSESESSGSDSMGESDRSEQMTSADMQETVKDAQEVTDGKKDNGFGSEEETANSNITDAENEALALKRENINYLKKAADAEAKWLWSQQMSNGAFAFYNTDNGKVSINPYFSEIVAIALINHDGSAGAKEKIERYFDWHISHINTASTDYNGLEGTIYDYTAEVVDGVVVSETSNGTYDSTDSYSALFIKALADYSKVYGDNTYLVEHKDVIKKITNVMFATMFGGYTYAKPDYPIIYLMDNAEVYAGLVAAKYIYGNVINDTEMLRKVSDAVAFYDNNFDAHWWKGDHYAAVLNGDYSEYTGYPFSWTNFYPCATSQMFPILYGLTDSDSQNARVIYTNLCNAWKWQEMDYISNGTTVFCWGNFEALAAKMGDFEKGKQYMSKYQEIVDNGRRYPLYSSEAAMVMMGFDEMIRRLNEEK